MVVMRQAPMVGRAAELRRLVELAEMSAGGRGVAVCVEGEPGIGRTTLLDALAAEATRFGLRVCRAAASQASQPVPFASLARCLGLAAWSPSGATGGASAPGSLEFSWSEAVLTAIEERCARGPVVLLLDDAQWLDPASVRTLRRLGALLPQLPLLLVATRRPGGTLLGGAVAAGTLGLGPLAESEVDELLTHMTGARPGPRLRARVATARGNPLHLTELIAALGRWPGIRVVAGVAEPAGANGSPAPPAAPAGSILRRVTLLSAPARQVVRVAAVLGPRFSLDEVAVVLGRSRAEVLPLLGEAVGAGLLGGIGEQYTFHQDVVRETLAGSLPADARGSVHRAVARALMLTGARAERVAGHVLAGGALEPEALGWLRASLDALVARAPELAVDLLRWALAGGAEDPDEEQAEALLAGYVRALLMAGRPAEAEQAVRGRLTEPAPRAVALRWLLAHACLQQGRPDMALAEAQQALRQAEVSPGAAARLHGVSAQCLFLLGRLVEAEAAAGLALAADPGRRAPARSGGPAQGPAYVPHRHPADALEETDQALSALAIGDLLPDQRTALLLTRGCCLEDLDRLEDADREFELGRQACERGDTTFLVWFHVSRARLWFFEGRWDDALAEIAAGREPADPLGLAPALDSLAAMVAVHRGDVPILPASTGGTAARCFDHLRRWVFALAAEAYGHPERALDLLADSWDAGRKSDPPTLPHRLCPDLARLAVTLGDAGLAREVADGTAVFAERRGTVSARGLAALCRGLAGSDAEALLAAADAFRTAGRPLFRAYAHENAAVVLARSGAGDAARDTLDTALELYGRMGAGWDATRAEGRAQEAGVAPFGMGLPSRPRRGWAALTGTERAVAGMVADGRSTPDIAERLFRSRRTVQQHVSSILAKLELTTRAELTHAVSRRRAATR